MRVSKGLNQNEVGELVGMAQSAVSKWERGATEPDHNTLRILSDYYGVSIDYLLGNSDEPQAKRKGVSIPVLGDVAAGVPIEAIEDILDYEDIDEDLARTGEFFALRIRGRSMEPRMMEGDVVIVRQQETAENGDTVVVSVNGDLATVKKIKIGPAGITLIPTNPSYDPMFFTREEVEQLPVRVRGKVVELRAKF
jgi:repressor LexA